MRVLYPLIINLKPRLAPLPELCEIIRVRTFHWLPLVVRLGHKSDFSPTFVFLTKFVAPTSEDQQLEAPPIQIYYAKYLAQSLV